MSEIVVEQNPPAELTGKLADLTDQDLRQVVCSVDIQPLLSALFAITEDESLLDADFMPPQEIRGAYLSRHGGLADDVALHAQELAYQNLKRLSTTPSLLTDAPSPRSVSRIIDFLAPEASPAYIDMINHEIGGNIVRTEESRTSSSYADRLPVLIVGAGVSGIAAAIQLDQAGIPYEIWEKNNGLGGTWWENVYPGCRLDTPNFAYSYSFAQKKNWGEFYSQQPSIRDYLHEVAETFEVEKRVKYGVKVTRLEFDESTNSWMAFSENNLGESVKRVFRAVISGTGQLNQPKYPEIRGLFEFEGLMMHSAQWKPNESLENKRVAVIGTGASAFQIVPEIAAQVDRLDVYQRRAPWLLPTPNYKNKISAAAQWLFDHLPGFSRWFRLWQFILSVEAWLPRVTVDPHWTGKKSVSLLNEEFRQELEEHLHEEFADRPDLLCKVVPDYPPGTKRMLRDDGSWASALKRDNVRLITDPIHSIDHKGIYFGDEYSSYDVIILATGFKADEFLGTFEVVGRNGLTLEEYWQGDARAYKTIQVPKFPNLFILLGPNAGLAANGSIVFMCESAAEYVSTLLSQLSLKGATAVEPSEDAYSRFSKRLDEENRRRAWGVEGASTWYQNRFGRVSQNWPFSLQHYYEITHRIDWEDLKIS